MKLHPTFFIGPKMRRLDIIALATIPQRRMLWVWSIIGPKTTLMPEIKGYLLSDKEMDRVVAFKRNSKTIAICKKEHGQVAAPNEVNAFVSLGANHMHLLDAHPRTNPNMNG
jgi:hypothetical protein